VDTVCGGTKKRILTKGGEEMEEYVIRNLIEGIIGAAMIIVGFYIGVKLWGYPFKFPIGS